tara:strand:- start:5903 stop:6934 length:1032 start_codon:yes stop_codon:yes gene_type:complete
MDIEFDMNSDNDTVKTTEKKKHQPLLKKVVWSEENEEIIVEWCDVAQCYKWLNNRAHMHYSSQHAWYTIPAIILSTISGTASFATSTLPPTAQEYAPVVIGSINIFIGILTTIAQFLKISELNEAHRVSSIAWDKFARNIRIELAKKPDERLDAGTFLKHCRDEYDRLMETSPSISEHVIKEFTYKFQGKEGSEKRQIFEELKKPDICDIIFSANKTRHKWYLHDDNNDDDQKNDLINKQTLMIEHVEKQLLLVSNEQAKTEKDRIKRHQDKIEFSKKEDSISKQKYNKSCIIINRYISNFYSMYSRKPLIDEIVDNLKDDIDDIDLQKFLKSYSSNGDIDIL